MSLRSKSTRTETKGLPAPSRKILGLISGNGDLPLAIASEAQKMGYRVVAIALQPCADDSLKDYADDFYRAHVGRVGEIVRILKKTHVSEVVIAGKVPKSLLFSNKKSLIPDLRALKVLMSLKSLSDEALLDAVSGELKKEGIKLLKTTAFTKNLLTPEGILTKTKPKAYHWKDIQFGWKIAKEIGRLDIGQTIVVRGTAVMAVEAIEGTDEAIMRGGGLAKDKSVVIKISRPQQDMRLDVPVVGTDTLETMKKVKAEVLAVEAGRSIIVNRDKFIFEADRAGIAVVGIAGDKINSCDPE
ncbi:MAG TPA: LpxI family protein [Nitrospirae bacterium]|nr:LpxI family protein [Nitrospirota bacterium]